MSEDTVEGGDQAELWLPTPQLRWKLVGEETSLEGDVVSYKSILQQRWQGSNGGSEWEDVPVIEEESKTKEV